VLEGRGFARVAGFARAAGFARVAGFARAGGFARAAGLSAVVLPVVGAARRGEGFARGRWAFGDFAERALAFTVG